MRKTLIIATLAVATLFTACKKQGATTPDTLPTNKGNYKTLSYTYSVNDTTMYHNIILDTVKARYGMQDTTFYEILRRTVTVTAEILDINLNVNNMAKDLNDNARTAGMLDSRGHLRENDTFISIAIAKIQYPALKAFYSAVNGEHGTGHEYRDALKIRIASFLNENEIIPGDPVTGFGDVYTQSDQNVFGTPLPSDFAMADAIGFQEGWDYSNATDGGITVPGIPDGVDAMTRNFAWAMVMACSASQAVACHDPNVH